MDKRDFARFQFKMSSQGYAVLQHFVNTRNSPISQRFSPSGEQREQRKWADEL